MRKVEQVKIFTGANSDDLETEYNEWFKAVVDIRDKVPALKGNPFVILDRTLTIRNYEGDETYALAVFYEHMELDPHEQGPDRAAGFVGGMSAVSKQRR